ncbi:MAG TPA: basic amino acid ABC transporter substrate-binding protein [Chloroflexi bacterium]|nr:basic amino acid ABC transporter substrate-binding protein [Chloroflexota bacterium]HHW87851.1 transporter substrate-binding domain-containing protein [Chloroflexota bacterium]
MSALSRVVGLGMLLFVVAACRGAPAPTATPIPPTVTSAPTAAPTVSAALVTPTATLAPQVAVVTVGIDPAFEPFVFTQDGKLAGFDVDLLNAMAAEGDFEVAYVVAPFNEILDGLQRGKFDAAISAITVTEDRKALVDFTAPYFESGKAPVSFYNPGQGIAIRTDNATITGPESLVAGVRVGVKRGTTGAAFAAEQTTAEIVEYADSLEAIESLTAGELDAVIVDIPVIVDYIKRNPTAGIRVTGGPVTDEVYAIAVSKAKPAVLAALNAALAKVQESGAYDQIYNRWFGAP